jgi:flagellin
MTSIPTDAAASAALMKLQNTAQNVQSQNTDADGTSTSSCADSGGTSIYNLDTTCLAAFMDLKTSLDRSSIGPQVDTELSLDSARLHALQVQQQLGVQSLSIANQASQSILKLFQ